MVGEKDDKRGRQKVEGDGTSIDETGGELREMLLRGEVAEEARRLKTIAPDDGHIAEEVVKHEEPDGDNASDDLGRGEGGAEKPEGGEVSPHQSEDKKRAKEGTLRVGGGDVGEKGKMIK